MLFTCSMVIVMSACSKKSNSALAGPEEPGTEIPSTPTPTSYLITETFDLGVKGSYAAGDVNLITGSWNFTDALIGDLPADRKEGTKSVRIRQGSISMNFDISGLKMLYIKHAKYGNDAASTWQLLMSVDGGEFTKVGNDIVENNTSLVTDSFAVNASGKVRFKIQKTGTARINIDNIAFRGAGDPGIVIGQPDTPDEETPGAGESETARDVTAGPDAQPASGDNSNLLFGNPSGAQTNVLFADNYLIDQKYYVQSYSSTRATPNWVSWHLGAEDIVPVSGRQDNFAAWSGLPASWYRAESTSYQYSKYGFQRGHNVPSADRTSSVNANLSTFLMTNIIPQAPNNNEKVWADFENYLRGQVAAGNEAYIIMGSYGTGGTSALGTFDKIADGKITVPSNIWKVAVIIPSGNNDLSRVSPTTRVIAINTPNSNSLDLDWRKYIVTIKSIETAAHLNLLSNLPQNLQDVLEVKRDSGY